MQELLEAGIALSSELSLDALLQKLVETAASLTGARYAALGVIGPLGTELERFVTHGVDHETHARIGDPPRGRGILGVLIREAEPLRLHDIADDPRSVGFPPHHPEMRTFLGVPILLRDTAYGNLYLTEKEGGSDFTNEDQELATLLAAQAAVAIENARLYESTSRWSKQLESLIEVGNALAGESELPRVLALVAERLLDLVEARDVLIALADPDGSRLRIAAAQGGRAEAFRGLTITRQGTKVGAVLERKRSERVDSLLDDPEIDRKDAEQLSSRAALFVPMVVRGRAIGLIVVLDKRGYDQRFSHEDFRLAEIFGERAAFAADLSERVAKDALRRVVSGQELERRRLARELHDETGQALTSVLLGLKALEESRGEAELRSSLEELRELVVGTLQDVRRLAVELRPQALDDFGLVPALERLTAGFREQTGIAIDLESRLLEERLPDDVETVLYRIVQEALTNVVKHARAEHVSIVLRRQNGSVTAVIEDDGRGFSPDGTGDEGLGLLGMRERVALVEGRLEIESAPGAGTTLVVEVPVS